MPPGAFGIESDGINLAVNLMILFLVVLYLALIAYVYLDARRRIEDPVLVACATVAALFPFVGPIIYSILRPPELLEDRRERELEIRAAELRVRQLREASCPNCEFPVERTFLRCPSCRARIKEPCESCSKPVDPRWAVCPYCETPTRRAAEPRRAAPARGTRPAARPARAKRPATRATAAEAKPKTAAAKKRASQRRPPADARSRQEPGDEGTRPAPAS